MSGRRTRVVIADANPLVRSVLRAVLDQPRLRIVGETATVGDLLPLCVEEGADVVVTDCDFPDGAIDELVPKLLDNDTAVVVFCNEPSPERLTALLDLGVSGYLLRDIRPEGVAECVFAAARGNIALHPVAASTVVDQWRVLRAEKKNSHALTPRELEVLEAMADGLATKAIAVRLGVAAKTVENHKIRVFDKLGVRSQAHAVAYAINHGLLPAAVGGA